VRMAEEFHAELVGLFVTQADMLALGALPTVRHLIGQSLTAQTLEPGAMERAMRVLAERARADLAAAAESRHVKWSFRMSSGPAEETIVAEAASCDVVTYMRGTRQRRTVGRVPHTRVGVLLATPEARAGRPIVFWSDDDGAGFDVALRLARRSGLKLLVFLGAGSAPEKAAEIGRNIAATGIRGEVRRMTSDAQGAAFRELRLAHPGLLIIGRSSPLAQTDAFENFVDSLDCTVFLAS
jgi:hypothetical protein